MDGENPAEPVPVPVPFRNRAELREAAENVPPAQTTEARSIALSAPRTSHRPPNLHERALLWHRFRGGEVPSGPLRAWCPESDRFSSLRLVPFWTSSLEELRFSSLEELRWAADRTLREGVSRRAG